MIVSLFQPRVLHVPWFGRSKLTALFNFTGSTNHANPLPPACSETLSLDAGNLAALLSSIMEAIMAPVIAVFEELIDAFLDLFTPPEFDFTFPVSRAIELNKLCSVYGVRNNTRNEQR